MKKGRKLESEAPKQLTVTFKNSGRDPRLKTAKLYYENDHFFGDLGPRDRPIRVNTYVGHRWTVMVGKKNLKTIIIEDPTQLEYIV